MITRAPFFFAIERREYSRTTSGAKEIRTPDLCSAIAALYQLSYSPTGTWVAKIRRLHAGRPTSIPQERVLLGPLRTVVLVSRAVVRSDGSRRGHRHRSHRAILGAVGARLAGVLG